MTTQNSVSASYDRVAADYTAQIAGELAGKPLDRALLLAFAEQAGALGPICDLGCGPGHVAAFLAAGAANVEGVDLSAGMIEQARRRYPSIAFRQGDMRSLDVPDGAFGGICAFYSMIHLQPSELAPAFGEWRRALCPGGLVLVAFHIGDTVVHLEEWWEQPVDLDFRFLQPEVVAAALQEAQFTVEALLRRAPYPGVEHPSERGYLLARKVSPST
jgi:SAM-dependent methyltransferase